MKLLATFATDLLDRMFDARKQPVDKWLGLEGTPGTPENKAQMEVARKIFKQATGVDLDSVE